MDNISLELIVKEKYFKKINIQILQLVPCLKWFCGFYGIRPAGEMSPAVVDPTGYKNNTHQQQQQCLPVRVRHFRRFTSKLQSYVSKRGTSIRKRHRNPPEKNLLWSIYGRVHFGYFWWHFSVEAVKRALCSAPYFWATCSFTW